MAEVETDSGARWQQRFSIGPGADQFEEEIRFKELESVNARRRAQSDRPEVDLPKGKDDKSVIDVVGLALSGGGIRSAAFSLGVLQALDQSDVLKRLDYLSTVSGGGYMGSSLTATMTQTHGEFVFGSVASAGAALQGDISDTDAVGHIRNYSNYLIPYGFRDVLKGLAIVVRGWVANLGIVLPAMLIPAAFTILCNPDRPYLRHSEILGYPSLPFVPDRNFGVAIAVSIVGLIAFFVWALWRSFLTLGKSGEFRTPWPRIFGAFLALLALIFFFELQPAVISQMFDVAMREKGGGLFSGVVTSWAQWVAALLAPVAALVTFFNKNLADLIKVGNSGTGWSAALKGILARVVVWVAGAALPLIIWIGYLYLCYWGIPNSEVITRSQASSNAECQATTGSIDLKFSMGSASGSAEGMLTGDSAVGCGTAAAEGKPPPTPISHRPDWLNKAAELVGTGDSGKPVIVIYVGLGMLILLLASLLRPNANSLHRLYRDRIAKAFLFDPLKSARRSSIANNRDFAPLDMELSELNNVNVPYHLINAALNVQGSDFANRRGRNADFFLFSPRYVGSAATCYVPTTSYEPPRPPADARGERPAPRGLNLGTALSVSGAAFSAAMGSKSIRALAPTLALLNVRLGYWLENPRRVKVDKDGLHRTEMPRGPHLAPWYIFKEMIGWLDERGKIVYVTDGGHIENLGIYELLRRRCKFIVVVDGEADPTMDFPSFIDLQRYARIDLGIRIRIPWKEISESTLTWMGAGSPANVKPKADPGCGPHIAVGTILYPGDQVGYLIYVKSSLTGDENDSIRDYARRNPNFPHETTSDQFFSEEQFEVYRALGFHAMVGFLDGSADVLVDTQLPLPPGLPPSPPQVPPSAPPASSHSGCCAAPAPPSPPGRKEKMPGAMIPGKDACLAEIRVALGLGSSTKPTAMPRREES